MLELPSWKTSKAMQSAAEAHFAAHSSNVPFALSPIFGGITWDQYPFACANHPLGHSVAADWPSTSRASIYNGDCGHRRAWVPLFSPGADLTFPANHKTQGGWVAGWGTGNRKPQGGWVAACAWRPSGVCRWWFLGPPQAPLSRASGRGNNRHKPRPESKWPITGSQRQAIALYSEHTPERRATASIASEYTPHSGRRALSPSNKPQTTGGLGGWPRSKKTRTTRGLGGWEAQELGK